MTRPRGLCVGVVLPLIAIAGCGGNPAPTRPSTASSVPSIAGAAPAQAAPVVIPWSCVTASVPRSMGIFASAAVEQTSCGARPRLLVEAAAATAPGVPPNLTSSVNSSTVTLTWTAPTSADPATSYVLEAGSSAGSSNILVFDTLSTATSFTATSVPAGTYFVRVRARNSAGTSAASNEVVVIVGGACTSAPGAPSGLTSSVSGSSVTLTWTGPAGGCAPTGYAIEAGSSSGSSNLANFNTGSTATTFSAGGVPNGTYFVRVRAANSNGQSGASNEINVIVGGGAIDVTGRWVGLAPDGLIFNDPSSCDAEHDITQFDIVASGGSLTGTMTTRTRALTPGRNCGVIGSTGTATFTVTVSGSTVTWSIPLERNRGTATYQATVSGNRMTGTIVGTAATFAVTKQ